MTTDPKRGLSIEETVARYAATMHGDPKAEDLYQEMKNSDILRERVAADDISADPYTYPDSSNRDESRMCDQVSENRSKRLMRAALDEVADKVCGDRHDDYGDPVINHQRTAKYWSIHLGIPISAVQVCELNALQKLSRLKNRYKHDGPIDIAGFEVNAIACAAAELPVNGT